MSTYYLPDTLLDTVERAINKTQRRRKKSLASQNLHFRGKKQGHTICKIDT